MKIFPAIDIRGGKCVRLQKGDFEKSTESEYEIKKEGNSVYIFFIEGEFKVENHRLKKMDALGVLDAQNVSFISESNSKTILVEVPICY